MRYVIEPEAKTHRATAFKSWSLLCAVCLSTTSATGAEADSPRDEVVVVTGNRTLSSTAAGLLPTNLFELPFSTTVLSSNILPDRLPNDVADLADYSPGTSRRSNYWGLNTPTFQLRGFNAGDSTAYYKDGFRYQARGPVAMGNVDAIEVLRGPSSAIYGWVEPGGVVQLQTKQATGKSLRQVCLTTDSWGHSQAAFDLSGTDEGNGAYRMVGASEQGGSFRDRQDLRQLLLAPSARWRFAGEREFAASLEYLDDRRTTDYGIPGVNGAPANVPVGRIYTEDWGRQHSRSTRLALRWSQPALGGRLSAAWSYYGLDYLEYRDAEPWSVTGTTVNRWYESYPEKYRWRTGYLDWAREFDAGTLTHRIATRFETATELRALYRGVLDDYVAIDAYNPIYGQAWTPTADYSVYDQAWKNHSYGVALQDEIVAGRMTVLLGIRYNYIRQVFDYSDYLPTPSTTHTEQRDHSLTPRIGVSWRATPEISIYGNVSAGNMPTLPQSRAFSGSAFLPMASRQYEIGIKVQPVSGDWLATAALFDIERKNVLTPDPDHAGFSIQTGVQRSRGLEAGWQGRFMPGWHLVGQATWLNPKIVSDNRYAPGNVLPYTAAFSASAWLTHDWAAATTGRWSISGGLVHQGSRFADFANRTAIPRFTRLDVAAGYQERALKVSVLLENLSNTRYFTSGVENRPAVIYPGEPRTLRVKVDYSFR